MNISDEAVAAAVKAFRETALYDDALMNALEAAAPHLMAAAWQEGFLEAIKAYAPTPSSGVMNNPYRSAGAGE